MSKFKGKSVDISLIPFSAQVAEAKAFMVGADKYGRYSFAEDNGKYKTASEHVSAIQRHLNKWFWNKEELDLDDGQPHLGSVRARAAMLIELIDRGLLIDDRPVKPQANSLSEGVTAPQQDIMDALTEKALKQDAEQAILTGLPQATTIINDDEGAWYVNGKRVWPNNGV